MAISKSLASKLKWGVGLGAGAALAVTPVGWAIGASGLSALAIDTAAGVALAPVTDKIQHGITHTVDHFIDKHTDKAKAKSKTKSTEKSDPKASSDTKTTSKTSSADAKSQSDATTSSDPITTILAALANNGSTNQNGRSVDSTISKFFGDSQTLQQNSQKNFDKELASVGLSEQTNPQPQPSA